MLKKLMCLFISFYMLSTCCFAIGDKENKAKDFKVTAKSAIVMEQSTGRVIYAKDIHKKRPLASTTKIMTALIALEQPNLDEYFEVDDEAIKVTGTSMGLKSGDKVTLNILTYGMLLPSGNDAANSVAYKVAGSIEEFSKIMNKRAKEIGMLNTMFSTPSGLDIGEHYSTAYDLALLAREALNNQKFRDICIQKKAKLKYGNPPYDRWLKNHNKLLSMYEDCIGIKTGFTKKAGRCLVSASENSDGETLICVTLGAYDDWNIHKNLFDKYFEEIEMTDIKDIIGNMDLPIINGNKQKINIVPTQELVVPLMKGEKNKITYKILKDAFKYAPLHKGQYLGNITIYIGNEEVLCTNLVCNESIDCLTNVKNKKNIIDKIKEFVLRLT